MSNNPIIQHLEKIPGFITVAKLGSMTNAAKQIGISQAALSQSIKLLEEVLGKKLLSRTRSGVLLTPEGEQLYQFGSKLLEDANLTHHNLENGETVFTNRIRIGTHEAIAVFMLPKLIEHFQKKYPDFSFSIVSGRISELTEKLKKDELDLLLTVQPRERDGIKTERVYSDVFNLYGDSNKKWKDKDLASVTLLTDSQSHIEEGLSLERVMAENGLTKSYYFQLNSFHAAIKYASLGLGLALLPEKIGSLSIKSGESIKKVALKGFSKSSYKHSIFLSYCNETKVKKEIRKEFQLLNN